MIDIILAFGAGVLFGVIGTVMFALCAVQSDDREEHHDG